MQNCSACEKIAHLVVVPGIGGNGIPRIWCSYHRELAVPSRVAVKRVFVVVHAAKKTG